MIEAHTFSFSLANNEKSTIEKILNSIGVGRYCKLHKADKIRSYQAFNVFTVLTYRRLS